MFKQVKMFGLFGNKKRIEDLGKEVRGSFDNVKQDFNKVGKWIEHIDEQQKSNKEGMENLKNQIFEIQSNLEELKELISFFKQPIQGSLSKQNTSLFNKQTVFTPVQTPVQTPNFYGISNLSITERAIVWLLVNSELKLSYEDIAAMLGKTKSTIRGQINSIKQKSEGLVEEAMERNGKKRVYVPEEIKEKMLKKTKVSVHKSKKSRK